MKDFLKRLSCVLTAVAALTIGVPVFGSDIVYPGGGTLAQVVDGGGTYSVITLVNLDSVAIPYNLYFYSDAGTPLTLSTTLGTNSFFNGVLPVAGSVIIRTNGTSKTISQGYAVVTSSSLNCPGFGSGDDSCQIAGSTVFGITLGSQVLEASCPLDTGTDSIIAIPFDSTTANTGLAIANSFGDNPYQYNGKGDTATLAIAFYDQSGNNFYSTSLQLASGQHTAFVLSSQFPQTIGKTGVMVITALDQSATGISTCGNGGCPYIVKALGLRVNLAGTTYTSVTPIIPCNYNTSSGCTN